MKRRFRRLMHLSVLAAWIRFTPFPAELLEPARSESVRILDREGRLLREQCAPDGTRSERVPFADISPWLVRATLVAEDRRFYSHPGVDPLAAARAAAANSASGRRVSGASTLTMQLVRLLRPRDRTWRTKMEEAALALRLERTLSKERILEEYLNRAPYAGNFAGAEAGARLIFGKRARDLSPAEAALLAGLPQSPSRLDPRRHPERARKRQLWILDEMLRLGVIDAGAHARAVAEPLAIAGIPPRAEAATFADWVLRPGDREVRTTLDLGLQLEVEGALRAHEATLAAAGAREAAVVVVHNPTGEIRAFAGPGARRRSPGSTLKPLIYALALERGATPATLYDDAPARFDSPAGAYEPRNYDGTYHGPVTLRAALANSLNIPAMLALRDAGVPRFLALARSAGLDGVDTDPRLQGLGLAIGDARVSPVELAGAFAMLARGGTFIRPHGRGAPGTPLRLLPPRTAWLVADILADDAARALSFGTGTDLAFDFPVAAKTGTSGDHRDNWVAGFTADWTVVVWTGNPDGEPLRGTSGLEGAGPVFRTLMLRLGGAPPARPPGLREAALCADSGLLPGPDCPRTIREWLFEEADQALCRHESVSSLDRLEISTPREGDRFYVSGDSPDSTVFLRFRARAPKDAELVWTLDCNPLATTRLAHEVDWTATEGTHELRITFPGHTVRTRFEVRR